LTLKTIIKDNIANAPLGGKLMNGKSQRPQHCRVSSTACRHASMDTTR